VTQGSELGGQRALLGGTSGNGQMRARHFRTCGITVPHRHWVRGENMLAAIKLVTEGVKQAVEPESRRTTQSKKVAA
jgi:hypothetical protein